MNKNHLTRYKIAVLLNFAGILGVLSILITALILEYVFRETPCLLCLMQRIGFIIIIFGFLFNLKFGFHGYYYGLSIMGALFTAGIALKQILMHIVPGTGSYGSPILGFYLYTWSFVIAEFGLIPFITLALCLDTIGFNLKLQNNTWINFFVHLIFAILLIVILLNIGSTYFHI